MTIENLKTLALIVLSSFLLWGYVTKDNPATSSKNTGNIEILEDIKLYSNGKLIGEWQGIGRGQMEGNTYVFETGRGSFTDEYRIKGDFVIKTYNN